eukprot:m.32070 g.32070  ORF g.32070 m.32070 type:complete len:55 (-) comp9752_c0_seq3:508-672(-)
MRKDKGTNTSAVHVNVHVNVHVLCNTVHSNALLNFDKTIDLTGRHSFQEVPLPH